MSVRWTLTDPDTDETWEFPFNPNKMLGVHAPRNMTAFPSAPLYNPAIEARGGMARVFETGREPYEWSFSGVIRTQAHYEGLLYWTRKVNKLVLKDHFDRLWSIRMESFAPDEKHPTATRAYRFDYEVKAIMYGAAA